MIDRRCDPAEATESRSRYSQIFGEFPPSLTESIDPLLENHRNRDFEEYKSLTSKAIGRVSVLNSKRQELLIQAAYTRKTHVISLREFDASGDR